MRQMPLLVTVATLMALITVNAPTATAVAAPDWAPVTKKCVVKDARIVENSGISRSTYQRPVWFAHNDSGDDARFFVLGRRCGTKAVFKVPGATSRDWEDMAVGPDHTLWFGDIGGNNPRSVVNVIRVKEPRTLRSRNIGYKSFELAYPDGEHNAEGLMVRPRSGRVYVVTKSASDAAIYRAPLVLDPDNPNLLTKVADAPAGSTGADFSRDGEYFVVRGYRRAYVFDSIDDQKPVEIDLPSAHRAGEAVMFARGGSLYFGAEGQRQWLWRAKP